MLMYSSINLSILISKTHRAEEETRRRPDSTPAPHINIYPAVSSRGGTKSLGVIALLPKSNLPKATFDLQNPIIDQNPSCFKSIYRVNSRGFFKLIKTWDKKIYTNYKL